jgi:catechol 2,3-dioxygenase-like lactoylglutathione lyase family enzyme
MTCDLHAICFAAADPRRLAAFWSGLLGWQPDGDMLRPPGDTWAFPLRFVRTDEPKVDLNRGHLHLTSTSVEDQQRTVGRALELGARHLDLGQTAEDGHIVLADPEGNEFDVIEPGNAFLAGCGFVGELACDGSQAVGYFWSAALGWPLVWDQDEETAIQSPSGGTKISWGGPPLGVRAGTDRLRFELVPSDGSDQQAEVHRLLSLGANRVGSEGNEPGSVELADPDGMTFTVLSHRRRAGATGVSDG